MSEAATGHLAAAAALSKTVLHPDVSRILETYRRLDSDEAKAHYADHFLGRTAGVMDKIWPAFYELLKCVEDGELYRKPGYLNGDRTFDSFKEYFEYRAGRPFETWAQMEQTYHYAQTYARELLEVAFAEAVAKVEEATEAASAARERALALADEVPLGQPGGDRRSEDFQSDNITLKSPRGTSESYLRRRLKRAHPDLYRAVDEGSISAHSAAIRVGIRHRNISVRADDPESAARTLRKHMPHEALMRLIELLTKEEL